MQPNDLPAGSEGLLGALREHPQISPPVSSSSGAAGSAGQLAAASSALTGSHLVSCQS